MKIWLIGLLASLACIYASAQNTHKLSRAESFWGLHFDRHSNTNDEHIGQTLSAEMIDSMLRLARPDYIQVDSKGHPGISSYPTQVGQQAKSYDKDPLALIREVTDKHNVALYVHYSGVMDQNYAKLHPEAARLGPDGKPDENNNSFWGSYSDKLLIPQLKELALKYHLDGVWIDGEAWAVYPDYQPSALKEFKMETGIAQTPIAATDPNYKAFLEFNRKKFITYIDHYTKEVHKMAPRFQICSNWAFSALMPEPVPDSLELDFLSGDYDPDNSLNTANWNVRCLAGQGRPFDLMAWSFVRPINPKTAIQLCQEAAAVISMGGGCQIYFRQNKDLSFQPASFAIMKEVADFMIPRREFCKDAKPIPQIGLFYSTAAWKSITDAVYKPEAVGSIRGTMNALLDGQHAVEVLMTHQLKKRINEYPVVVVPAWEKMEPEVVGIFKEYVKQGGRLLVIGATATSQFNDILGITQIGQAQALSQSLGFNEHFVTIEGTYQKIKVLSGTNIIALFFETNDLRFPSGIAATIHHLGKGAIAGIYADIGTAYLGTTSPVLRDLLSAIMDDLLPHPIVIVKGSHKVNIIPTIKNGRFLIQVVNTSGDHANVNVKGIDEIPVLTNLQLSVRTARKPRSVLLHPGGQSLKFNYADGRTAFSIPELKIHHTVEIKE